MKLYKFLGGFFMNGFKNVGLKIKYYREERGFSKEVFAKMTSMSVEKVNEIENGEIVYNFSTLFRIAAALQVELPDLLDFE